MIPQNRALKKWKTATGQIEDIWESIWLFLHDLKNRNKMLYQITAQFRGGIYWWPLLANQSVLFTVVYDSIDIVFKHFISSS